MGINNLYVTYDDDSMPHFHIGDEEVSESVWRTQHPHMSTKGEENGRDSDSGQQRGSGEQERAATPATYAESSDLRERVQAERLKRAKSQGTQAE